MQTDKKIINYDKFGYPIYLVNKTKTPINIDYNGRLNYSKKRLEYKDERE